MNILVIEDNIRISDNILLILKNEGYNVVVEEHGDSGYKNALVNQYDLIVLDIMLPGMSGYEILEALRANQVKTPVIVLSAKSQVEDKVKALDLGSDDYLTKPFAPTELLARVRSVLRRQYDVASSSIHIGELNINTHTKELDISGKKIPLTSKEYELLEFLAYNHGKVVSRIAIGEHIWGESLDLFTMSNFIDVHIKNLRKKIESVANHKYIQTKRGVGFILKEEN
ncbi:MAG: response regulator transcription factor [Spirochaetes bacterium]|nr:response regulator transcription factor [Spirochaetota bacterium]